MLSEAENEQLVAAVEEEINEAVHAAEIMPPMAPDSFFDYTSATLTARQQEQRADLLRYTQPEQHGKG
jgi:pyruvate dehydrogenase E1 component alpha subunit